jgi:assimilatory nitrate reductase catalytic subunit
VPVGRFDVSENKIAADLAADLAAGLDLAALQGKRKCGTSCGSCLPELRRMTIQCNGNGA